MAGAAAAAEVAAAKPAREADREDAPAAAAWSPQQAYGGTVPAKASAPDTAGVAKVAQPAAARAETKVAEREEKAKPPSAPQVHAAIAGAEGLRGPAQGDDAEPELPVPQRAQVATTAGVGAGRIGGIGGGYRVVRYIPSDKVFRSLPQKPEFYPKDARYRSNYLPGRGALAHLAAEIDKGSAAAGALHVSVPQPPPRTMPPPETHAIRVAADLSHRVLPLTGGRTVLRVRLRSADKAPATRGPLHLHLVLDQSGSMKGKPWQQVCAAVRDLSTRLLPTDRLSVVMYSHSAEVLARPQPGGPELAQVAERVCRTKPHGETHTAAGLQLGYQMARESFAAHATNRVLLVSDGMPTIGPNEPYLLTMETARALGEGITTSALGVGRDFDALLMGRVALEGGGNSHFVRDATALPAVLTDELEVLSRQAAEAVDVRIRLPQDVRLVEVVGSEPLNQAESLRVRAVEVAADQRLDRDKGIAADRQQDAEGGVRFLLPSFRAGDEHAFVLVLEVPPGDGWHEVAQIAVRYKDTVAGENAAFEGVRGVEMGANPETAEAMVEPAVLLAEARARAGSALQRASEYLAPANIEAIRAELYAAATDLQRVADRIGSAPAHAEADRMRGIADTAALVLGRGQSAWMITWLHYDWRLCGVTAWGG